MSELELLMSDIPEPEYNWHKPSLAVIATGNSGGCVLWTAGPHLQSQIDEIGNDLEYLGLSDAPEGISVWEGVTKVYRCFEGDLDVELVGEFRDPNPDEWQSIMRGECPWDGSDWAIHK